MSLFRRLRRRLARTSSRRKQQVMFTGCQPLENRMLLSAVTAVSAEALLDSIGINTHFGRNYGVYTHPDLPDTLAEIGFRHIRDNTGNTTAVSHLSYLYDTYGITTNMTVDWLPLDIATRVNWLSEDWAESIEGPNEADLADREYAGLMDAQRPTNSYLATRQYQAELYNAVKSNPATADKPVLLPADAYSVYAKSFEEIAYDILAYHDYPGGQRPESMDLIGVDLYEMSKVAGASDQPVYMTETGYHTATQSTDGHSYVPLDIQAKYIPRSVVDSFMAGVDRNYLYELADNGTDLTEREQNFGLVYNQTDAQQPLQLKPAGETLKRFFDLLDDSTSASFTPDTFDFTIDAGSADISNLRTLLVQENDADGTFNLIVWQDLSSFQTSTKQVITNPDLNITVRFNEQISSAKVYNLNSDTPIYTSGWNPRTVSVAVPDELLIIQLTPGTYNPGGSLPEVSIEAIDPVAVEGTSDTGQFKFTRSGGDINQPFTVWLEILGEAVKGTDYANINNSVTFAAGSTTAYLTINANNDSVVEGDEQVTMRISGHTATLTSEHWADTVTITDDEAMSDLVITDISWNNDHPQVGDAISYQVTVKNQGTRATVGNAQLYLQPGSDWTQRLETTVNSGLAAGASTVITLSGTWTAQAGQPNPTARIDSQKNVMETNEDNNYYSEVMVVPFAFKSEDFEQGLDTSPWTGWDVTGNWQAVSYGGNTVLQMMETSTSDSMPLTTYLPTTFATQWSAEFEYDWLWGGNPSIGYGHYTNIITQDFLDDSGNGYRVVVHQGNSNNVSYTNKTIQIFQVNNGVVASTSLAEGAGYNESGFKSQGQQVPDLKTIKVTFDQIAGSLRVFGDADGDGQLEMFAEVRGDLAYDRFTHTTFKTSYNSSCAPVIDNIHVDLHNPLDAMRDDFESDTPGSAPSGWYTSGTWQTASYNGNIVTENLDASTGGRYISHGWTIPYDGSWEASLDYDWMWGGNASLGYGYYYLAGQMDVLDANGNGYRLIFHQGDHNNASNTDKVFELYRRDNWSTTTLLATSSGYNEAGWKSQSQSEPDLKRVMITYEPSMQTLSVYADPDRDGDLDLMIQYTETGTPHEDIDRLYIEAKGMLSATRFTLDNVRVDQLHTRDFAAQTYYSAMSGFSASAAMVALATPGATLTPVASSSSWLSQLTDSSKDRWMVTLLEN